MYIYACLLLDFYLNILVQLYLFLLKKINYYKYPEHTVFTSILLNKFFPYY